MPETKTLKVLFSTCRWEPADKASVTVNLNTRELMKKQTCFSKLFAPAYAV